MLQPLDPGRLVIRNPTEVFNAFEQSMKFGALYNQPATPRGNNMVSSSFWSCKLEFPATPRQHADGSATHAEAVIVHE